MPTAASGPVRPLAMVAFATAVLDLAVLVLLHLLQPEVDVMHEPTSTYVHGTLGFLSPLSAGAVGAGAISLAAALWRVASGTGFKVGSGLLILFGLAKLAQAFFPIDAPGQASATGAVHNLLGNVAFFVLPVAAALVTGAVAQATGRRRPAWWPVLVSWALVVLTVLVLAGDALGWFGPAQRLYLVGAAVWTAAVASWVLRPRP